MTGATHSFTTADYRAILDTARKHGFSFARFTDPDPAPEQRVVYMRHDVDNCLESARLMAEIEAEAGAVSTYFVMVRSQNYNVFSGASVGALRRIRALGHDIGLHFTAAEHRPEELGRQLADTVAADARLLEAASGGRVGAFSFHNPAETDGFALVVPGLVNAYAPRFFAPGRYLSESNMRWGHGSPIDLLASEKEPVVQILVHPLSYRADFTSDRDVLLWFLRDATERLLAVNVAENRVLREQGVSLREVAEYIADDEPRAGAQPTRA